MQNRIRLVKIIFQFHQIVQFIILLQFLSIDSYVLVVGWRMLKYLMNVNIKFLLQMIQTSVSYYFSRCPRCVRFKRCTVKQNMGQLPIVRVTQAKPFARMGVDFAEPYQLRKNVGKMLSLRRTGVITDREPSTVKSWVIVYVCLATRAIHLDITTGLTVDDFLETFVKFTSHRGMCNEVWSDNGTNFVGASKELSRVLKE